MPCGASGKNKREEACCIDGYTLNQYRHQSERPEKPPAADHAAGGFRTFQIGGKSHAAGRKSVCEKPRKGFLHNSNLALPVRRQAKPPAADHAAGGF